MAYFGLLFFPFGAAFVIHVLLWRVRKPKAEIKTLFVIFMSSLIVALGLGMIPQIYSLSVLSAAYLIFFYISMTLAYLLSYTALQEIGPSFLILLHVYECGNKGLPVDSLGEIITNERFFTPRLRDLEAAGHISRKDAGESEVRFFITPAGKKFLKLFMLPRKILGIRGQGG